MMDEQEMRLQVAEVVGTWVAALAVVIGGLFGIYQYLEHKSAVRIDRTMDFVERYHGSGVLVEARLKITASMSGRTSEINRILQDPNIAPEALPKKYNEQILKIVMEDELSSSLQQLFTFYEQIVLCREMELCEEKVTQEFFDVDARGFVRSYYPYICHLRQEWNNPKQYERVTHFYGGNSGDICQT